MLAASSGRPEHADVRHRALFAVLFAPLVIAGCGVGQTKRITAQPPPSGGLTGREAVLYRYAYTHCLPFGTKSANSNPTGSKPVIYDMSHAYPLVMLGRVRPHSPAQWTAAKDGCALGIVTAFADAHSSLAPAVCRHMSQYLPAKVPDCPNLR